eukprot:9503894-Pyramimonas_sp.AAC.1
MEQPGLVPQLEDVVAREGHLAANKVRVERPDRDEPLFGDLLLLVSAAQQDQLRPPRERLLERTFVSQVKHAITTQIQLPAQSRVHDLSGRTVENGKVRRHGAAHVQEARCTSGPPSHQEAELALHDEDLATARRALVDDIVIVNLRHGGRELHPRAVVLPLSEEHRGVDDSTVLLTRTHACLHKAANGGQHVLLRSGKRRVRSCVDALPEMPRRDPESACHRGRRRQRDDAVIRVPLLHQHPRQAGQRPCRRARRAATACCRLQRALGARRRGLVQHQLLVADQLGARRPTRA